MNNVLIGEQTIPNFENYTIDINGIVKNKFGRTKSPYRSGGFNKYLKVDLYKNGVRRKMRIHRLVFSVFSNIELERDEDIHHKDRNTFNNCLSNLEKMIKEDHKYKHKSYSEIWKEKQNKREGEKDEKENF